MLAAATLGVGVAETLRARVTLDTPGAEASFQRHAHRLIVQSYAKSVISASGMPHVGAKPVASLQRAVTGAQLRGGIKVDIVNLQENLVDSTERLVVLAWVERGDPDLDYDARQARPSAGAVYGWSQRSASGVEILLRQTA